MTARKTEPKPPSKRQQQAAEKRDKLARKLIEKAITTAMREIGRQECSSLAKAPPPEFQKWGVVKTRAWTKAAKECARIAARPRPHPQLLQHAATLCREVNGWPLERCHQFIAKQDRKASANSTS